MDVIRRIFGRSFARARASNRAKDWPVPAQGFRFPRHSAPQRRRKPSGGRGGKCRNRAQEHHAPAQGPWVAGSRRGSAHARRRGAGESICTLWTPRRTRLRRRGAHPTSEGRGNGRWTALGESVHAIQVTDGRLEARSDRLVGRARGAEIDGDTCCEPRATARGRGGRRRGTLAPDPSGRRRRLDGRSERAAQARSRGRPRSHASSRDDVGRPWRGPYERAATGLGVVQVRSGSAPVASRISA